MGKRRIRKSQPNEPVAKWSPENELKLLSWLDFSVKHPEIDFQTTVVDHLGNAFSLQQIDRKLAWFWHKYGPTQTPGTPKLISDVKTNGTLHLGISENERNQIRLAIEALEVSYGLSPSRRKLRSTSKLGTSTSPLSSRWTTPAVQKLETSTKRKRDIDSASLTASEVKNENKQARVSTSRTEIRRKGPKTYSKRDNGRLRATARSPESLVSRFKPFPALATEERRSSTMIRDSEDDVSVTVDEQHDDDDLDAIRKASIALTPSKGPVFDIFLRLENKNERAEDGKYNMNVSSKAPNVGPVLDDGKDSIECSQCQTWQHAECVKHLCLQCLENAEQQPAAESITCQIRSQADFCTETDEQSDPKLQGAMSRIEELEDNLVEKENQLQEAEQLAIRLTQEIGRMENVRKEREEKYGFAIEEQMAEQQKQIKKTTDELKAHRRLRTFDSISSRSPRHVATTGIEKGYRDTHNDVNRIFRDLDVEEFSLVPQLDQDKRLLKMAQKILGSESDHFLQSAQTELAMVSHVVILRAFTASALHEWVFESDFPQFKGESALTLALYRDMLRSQGGPLMLRSIDLAAFELKIEKPEFQALILPREAQALAIRLSQTLAPFFTCSPQKLHEQSWDGFATWGDVTEVWKERREQIVSMFAVALETKAMSCLNIEDYEMVLYAPGTSFDPETMDVETMEGAKVRINNHEGRVVRICIQAALFAYPRDDLSDEASVSESIVSTQNFVGRNKGKRKRAAPRVKAVVVLRDGDVSSVHEELP